jgi:hypothetical protein
VSVAHPTLGIAYTRLIPSEDAAPAMTNAVVLPPAACGGSQ